MLGPFRRAALVKSLGHSHGCVADIQILHFLLIVVYFIFNNAVQPL